MVSMLKFTAEKRVINPLESSPEAKPYKNHKDIQAMSLLITFYEKNEINQFEQVLKANRKQFEEDKFLLEYIPDLIRSCRMKVLCDLVKPYKRIRLSYLGKLLRIENDLVETLCSDLVLDSRLNASIDQVDGVLLLESTNRDESAKLRYDALSSWVSRLESIHTSVLNKIE